jgi:hypothetical protein
MSNDSSIYRKGSCIMSIITEDITGRKEIRQKVNLDDEDSVGKVFKLIIDKYGLNLKIIKSENINSSWLKADEEFHW